LAAAAEGLKSVAAPAGDFTGVTAAVFLAMAQARLGQTAAAEAAVRQVARRLNGSRDHSSTGAPALSRWDENAIATQLLREAQDVVAHRVRPPAAAPRPRR
jgi:hypothetical protein